MSCFCEGTGRTNLSTIAQITGALLNIILDPIFIFGLDMGVTGAAAATVVGQLASLGMAMLFHYRWDKEMFGRELETTFVRSGD